MRPRSGERHDCGEMVPYGGEIGHRCRIPPLATALHDAGLGCRLDFRGDRDCDGAARHAGSARALLGQLDLDALAHREGDDCAYLFGRGCDCSEPRRLWKKLTEEAR